MIPEQDLLLIQQLRNNERSAYLTVYETCFPGLARYILRNQGTTEDAEDNFQECMLLLLQRVRSEVFELKSTLKTYLFAVNRNLWLKKLRERKINVSESLTEEELLIGEQEPYLIPEHIEQEKSGLLSRLFENITSHCVILITRIFLTQQEPESLIRELGYKNAHTFQNQKYKCINQLRKAGKKFPTIG